MNVFDLVAKITLDLSGYESGLEDASKKASSFGDKLKKGLGVAAKISAAAVGAASTAVVALTKNAVQSYADYEQLVGGVETLFKDSADTVQAYAANAYKTAGLSANEYMETVTSFSASLISSLDGDTKRASQLANMAITDMSDNANKMGVDIERLQSAYSGFARGNFTMLDNLSLGYAGTKEGMQQLLEDAMALKAAQGELAEYSIDSYADMVEAIHVVQTEWGITGTTAKEASTTISGSISSMRSAWDNLVVGIADDNADIDLLIDNFVESVITAGENIIPRVEKTLGGISKLVTVAAERLIPMAVDIIIANLPQIIQSGVQLVVALASGLIKGIPQLVKSIPDIIDAIISGFVENWPGIREAGRELLDKAKEGAMGVINNAQTWGRDLVDKIKSGVSARWSSFYSDVSSKFENVHTKISDVFNRARNTVSNAINGIRNLFNFEWHLPHISLPTFTWDWQDVGGILKLPSIHVSWNRKAYDTPYLFSEPTVLQGFGDGPGDEMVYGRASLMEDIREASGTDGMTSALETMIGQLQTIIEHMQFSVVLDDGTLVGRLAPRTDDTLNELNAWRGRGLSIA